MSVKCFKLSDLIPRLFLLPRDGFAAACLSFRFTTIKIHLRGEIGLIAEKKDGMRGDDLAASYPWLELAQIS